MTTTIRFETELTREGLEAVRADIDRLLAALDREPSSENIEWRVPSLAERRVNQLWPRLGENLRRFLASCATDFSDGDLITLEALAERLDTDLPTVRSWHRNLSRSLKRVDRELGPEPPFLTGEWSEEDWRMHYRMPSEVRRAIHERL